MAIVASGNHANGTKMIVVGIEERNVELMREGNPMHIELKDKIGLPYTLVVFYGRTMNDLVEIAGTFTGPETAVRDTRKRKRQ
jgi:hypothetical protein